MIDPHFPDIDIYTKEIENVELKKNNNILMWVLLFLTTGMVVIIVISLVNKDKAGTVQIELAKSY